LVVTRSGPLQGLEAVRSVAAALPLLWPVAALLTLRKSWDSGAKPNRKAN
jgi:hypothetical protein